MNEIFILNDQKNKNKKREIGSFGQMSRGVTERKWEKTRELNPV